MRKSRENGEAYLEISDVVGDVLDRVRDDHDPHVDQVRGGHIEDTGRKLLAVSEKKARDARCHA